MKQKFWFVWNDSTTLTPKYKHETLKSAQNEAKRLAKSFPGNTFVVLESISEAQVNCVIWTHHENKNPDIPF